MFRRGTTTKERGPSERPQPSSDVRQDRPVGEQPGPYSSEARREPRRGDGHAVREEERMVGRAEMVERAPLSMGQYLANWFTLLAGTALVFFETVLALRLFFKLTTADNTNGFVKLVYHFSGAVIRPFDGIISNQTVVKGGILEPSVLIAMALFLIGAVLAIWVVRSLASVRSWGSGLIWR